MNIRIPLDRQRTIRLAPHRFGQIGNMFVIEDDNGDRIDLYLSDAQVTSLVAQCVARLNVKAVIGDVA